MKRMTNYMLFMCVSCVLFFYGCATVGLHETARTTPKKKTEYGVSGMPIFIRLGADNNSKPSLVPWIVAFLKYGVRDNFDVGLRWMPFFPFSGMTFSMKYQFLNKSVDGAFTLISSIYYQEKWLMIFSPRLILSNESEQGIPFMINAGVSYDLSPGEPSSLAVVGGLGVPYYIGANKKIRIMPEVSIVVPLRTHRVFTDYFEFPFYEGGDPSIMFGVSVGFLDPD